MVNVVFLRVELLALQVSFDDGAAHAFRNVSPSLSAIRSTEKTKATNPATTFSCFGWKLVRVRSMAKTIMTPQNTRIALARLRTNSLAP